MRRKPTLHLRHAVIALTLLLPATRSNAQGNSANLSAAMRLVAGEWDWSGDSLTCRKNPHTLSFTPDSAFMVLRYRTKPDSTLKQEYRYRILKFSDHSITGRIEGEQRRNASGQPVAWELVLTGRNSYRWRQTDSSPQAMTRAVVRCRDAEPLSEAQ